MAEDTPVLEEDGCIQAEHADRVDENHDGRIRLRPTVCIRFAVNRQVCAKHARAVCHAVTDKGFKYRGGDGGVDQEDEPEADACAQLCSTHTPRPRKGKAQGGEQQQSGDRDGCVREERYVESIHIVEDAHERHEAANPQLRDGEPAQDVEVHRRQPQVEREPERADDLEERDENCRPVAHCGKMAEGIGAEHERVV